MNIYDLDDSLYLILSLLKMTDLRSFLLTSSFKIDFSKVKIPQVEDPRFKTVKYGPLFLRSYLANNKIDQNQLIELFYLSDCPKITSILEPYIAKLGGLEKILTNAIKKRHISKIKIHLLTKSNALK